MEPIEEYRFTDAESGESWLVRPHDGPIARELLRLAARDRAQREVLSEAAEWADVQTGNIRQGADRYFADAARALLGEE